MRKLVYSSIICSGQKLEVTQMPINRKTICRLFLSYYTVHTENEQTTITYIHMEKLKNKMLIEKEEITEAYIYMTPLYTTQRCTKFNNIF